MSTNQSPGGPAPDGSPSYAQPQDPWAGGFEPGVASVPTDPLPHPPQSHQQQPPPYGGYRADAWSQQTVVHPGQYPSYVLVPPPRSRTGLIILIFILVLVLGGGGGYAAWYVTTQRAAGQGGVTPTVPTSPTAPAFDPYAVKVGDCLFNNGTASAPSLAKVACSTPKSYKVVKVAAGTEIPENPAGAFDRDVTSVAVCQGITYQSWYGYQDSVDDSRDLFFCMTNNP